jgi:hypothetical protein
MVGMALLRASKPEHCTAFVPEALFEAFGREKNHPQTRMNTW